MNVSVGVVSSNFKVENNTVLLSHEWYMSRKFSVSVLSVLFILPLVMLKTIGALSWTRYVHSKDNLYAILSVTLHLLNHLSHTTFH